MKLTYTFASGQDLLEAAAALRVAAREYTHDAHVSKHWTGATERSRGFMEQAATADRLARDLESLYAYTLPTAVTP
jgi:hypothetical protein